MNKPKVVTKAKATEEILNFIEEFDNEDLLHYLRQTLKYICKESTPTQLENLHFEVQRYVRYHDEELEDIKVLKDTKATKILLTKR